MDTNHSLIMNPIFYFLRSKTLIMKANPKASANNKFSTPSVHRAFYPMEYRVTAFCSLLAFRAVNENWLKPFSRIISGQMKRK